MEAKCPNCGQVSERRTCFDMCFKCRDKARIKFRNNKGMKEYNQIVNYFLRLDRSRGMSYAKLARVYKLDASNIYKRVNGTLNKNKADLVK